MYAAPPMSMYVSYSSLGELLFIYLSLSVFAPEARPTNGCSRLRVGVLLRPTAARLSSRVLSEQMPNDRETREGPTDCEYALRDNLGRESAHIWGYLLVD